MLLIIVQFLAVIPAGYTQSITAESKVDTNKMLIGDQVTLTLRVIVPSDILLLWPEIRDEITATAEVVDRMDPDTLKRPENGFIEVERVYII